MDVTVEINYDTKIPARKCMVELEMVWRLAWCLAGSLQAHCLDYICCLKSGASAQQPGQCGGVGFSAEAWHVRQESSSQRFQGKKDLVGKVFW